MLKVGDLIKASQASEQDDYKWVVLSPLTFNEKQQVIGGTVMLLTEDLGYATDRVIEAHDEGRRTIILEGRLPALSVGDLGVFV